MPKSLFGIFFNMDNEVVQFQNLPGANGDPQGKKKIVKINRKIWFYNSNSLNQYSNG